MRTLFGTILAATDTGCIYVDAGPLGFDDENKAIGLFSHSGVANHPGDLGMRRLAKLILSGFAAAEDNPVSRAAVVRIRSEEWIKNNMTSVSKGDAE